MEANEVITNVEEVAVENQSNNRNSEILEEFSIAKFKKEFAVSALRPAYASSNKGTRHLFLINEVGLRMCSVSDRLRAKYEAGEGLPVSRVLKLRNLENDKISYVATDVDTSRLEIDYSIVL